MAEIDFPWWVRWLWFLPRGNDGLTRFERRHLAREWRRTVCAPITPAEREALRKWREERGTIT